MKTGRRTIGWVIGLAASVMLVFAGTELVLRDGRVLSGTELRRDDGNYVLTLEDGEAITLPAEVVDSVRLTGEGRAETLAGEPIRQPSREEQLQVLGPQARFQEDIVDNDWEPTSDWEMTPEKNNFNPSTWSKPPIDPSWEPESSWDEDEDVLASGRTEWKESIIDPGWAPTDGFATSVGRR
jgi:hypothetical protein